MSKAQNQVFSVNAASEILGKDRGTINRAIADLKPDAHEGGQPRWRLASIVAALGRRDPSARQNGTLDEIERLGEAVADGFKRLEAEPSLDKRRAMVREVVGLNVGRLDRAFAASVASAAEHEQPILQVYADSVVRGMIGTMLQLCELEYAGQK
jgi:hypothetical protein